MKLHRLFSGMGGTIAVICILFLPIVGCGGETATGLDVLKSDHIPGNIQCFIGIAVILGVVVILAWNKLIAVAASIGGAVSLLIAYNIAHGKMNGIELKEGAYFALTGFCISVIAAALTPPDTEVKQETQSN